MPYNKEHIYKVILIQLPDPQFEIQKHWGNSPLAAGYLKTRAFQDGLLDTIDIEILNDRETNLFGDARLIERIISKKPDMIGWSLFLWNAKRCLYISSEIKKRCPEIRIIVGGPEVTIDSHYILNHPAIDIGCFGEGETAFVEILNTYINGKPKLSDINNIFYKTNNNININEISKQSCNSDRILSPFVLGYIDVKNYKQVSYEISRGCPYNCAYCQTATISFSSFPIETICEDIKFFIENNVRTVRFIDSDVTLHPKFLELFTKIKEINIEKKIVFIGYSYAEYLKEEEVCLMKECNFYQLEIGLQTINNKTLKIIRRPVLKPDGFIKGIRLLEKYGINYVVDTIIGLPGESFDDYQATTDFLKSNRIGPFTSFPLMVIPGTRLNRMAGDFGIVHDKKPPYYLIETDSIDKKGVWNAQKFQTNSSNSDSMDFIYNTCFDPSVFDIDMLHKQKVSSNVDAIHKCIIDMETYPNSI